MALTQVRGGLVTAEPELRVVELDPAVTGSVRFVVAVVVVVVVRIRQSQLADKLATNYILNINYLSRERSIYLSISLARSLTHSLTHSFTHSPQ